MSERCAHEQLIPGRWWHRLDDGRIQCDLCPRDCRLHEGQRGACFVRQREGDAMVLTTYGRSSGFCIDPIEKKPLNHFYPGSSRVLVRHRRLQPRVQVLPELGHLEVARDGHADGRGVAARRSPRRAAQLDCRSVAFTYNDPGHLRRVRDGHRRRVPRAAASRRSRSRPATSAPTRGASSTRRWTPPTSTSRASPTSST